MHPSSSLRRTWGSLCRSRVPLLDAVLQHRNWDKHSFHRGQRQPVHRPSCPYLYLGLFLFPGHPHRVVLFRLLLA